MLLGRSLAECSRASNALPHILFLILAVQYMDIDLSGIRGLLQNIGLRTERTDGKKRKREGKK